MIGRDKAVKVRGKTANGRKAGSDGGVRCAVPQSTSTHAIQQRSKPHPVRSSHARSARSAPRHQLGRKQPIGPSRPAAASRPPRPPTGPSPSTPSSGRPCLLCEPTIQRPSMATNSQQLSVNHPPMRHTPRSTSTNRPLTMAALGPAAPLITTCAGAAAHAASTCGRFTTPQQTDSDGQQQNTTTRELPGRANGSISTTTTKMQRCPSPFPPPGRHNLIVGLATTLQCMS